MNNLRFADDIHIIEQSNEKLLHTVDKLHTESERYGMHITVVKTKKRKRPEENDAKVNIDGQAMENVKSVIHLGSEFAWDDLHEDRLMIF